MKRHIRTAAVLLTLLALTAQSCTPAIVLSSPDSKVETTVTKKKNGSIRSLTVVTENGKYKKNLPENTGKFEYVDLNFDGEYDIRVLISVGNRERYKNFLITNGELHEIKQLDSMLSPEYDEDAQTVSAPYFKHTVEPATDDAPEVYIDEEGISTYKWVNNKLTEVYRECTTYYSENEIYCIAVWETNTDGELEPVTEHWVTKENYTK